MKRDYAMASRAVDQLNETQRGIAYDTGKAVYDRRMDRERQKFSQENKGAAITREGTVSLAGATVQGQRLAAVVQETMTRRQRDSVDVMRRLARVTGVDVVFYQSRTNEKGEYTAANGFYRDGTVYLDINAGKNRVGDMSQTAILLTASHELTHFIKEYNPAQYEQLRTFVVERLMEAEDVDLDALVQRHRKDQPELSYDEALDEVVADGCQMMLKDSRAAAALAKQNRSLAGNIRSWLRKWVKKLQEAFRGLTAQKPEAQALTRYAKELQKIWDDALVGAARNLQQSGAETASGEKAASTRGKASARDSGGRIARAVNGEDYWNDLSYRGYRRKVIPDSIGYAMFADDPSEARGYGDRFAAVRHDDLPKIDDFKEAIAEAWERDKDEGLLPPALEVFEDLSGAEVADHFDPVDILDGADAWDTPELITWAFSHGIFDEVGGIKTSDGAIVWDDSLIHDTSGDDGVWGDNLHRQSDPAVGESTAQVRYEIRHPTYTEDDLENNSIALQTMEVVTKVTGDELGPRNMSLKERVTAYFASLGNNIYTEAFGDVALSNSSVHSEIRHGHTSAKVATYAAIPDVLNSGVVIFHQEKNRYGLERLVVAAPVAVGSNAEKMYVGVMLQRDPQTQRLYLHDAVAEKEPAAQTGGHLSTTGPNGSESELYTTTILRNALNVKKNAVSTTVGGVTEAASSSGGTTPTINTASKDSIRSGNEKSNTKFSVRDNKEDVKTVEKYFGTTYNVNEAGYLLTDGKLLDMSGRHEGGPGGYRTVDHRDIADAFDGDYGDGSYSGGMVEFMRAGNIRLSPESGGINLSVKPNKAQLDTLDRYISKFRGEVMVDFDNAMGDTVASAAYRSRTYSKRILDDINAYFDNGTVPTGNADTWFSVREAKITDRELLANALETTARNDLERGLLAQYQEKAKSAAQWERWLDYHRQKLADHESGAHPLTTQQVLLAREKAAQYAEKLDQLDEKLLKIESMGPMRKLLERERTYVDDLLTGAVAAEKEHFQADFEQRLQEARRREQESRRRTRVVGTFPDSNSAGTCKQFCA